ncbi:MAG: hypothetical protein JNK85_14240 [Verrucomicrobiales bacterium]|nr:hypothetical protein [Verrucomicrobiales bacterium]
MKSTLKTLKVVAMVALGGVLLVEAAFKGIELSRNSDCPIHEREAFKAGVVYGKRAADLARSKGLELVTFDDSAIDDLRVTLTAGRYQDTRLPFIDGFRHGFESARASK